MVPPSGRRGGLLGRLLTLGAACLCLAIACGRAAPPPPRVLLLGVDGVDPAIVARLVKAGRLPTLARLEREGAYGPLRSHEPLLSPLVWTTIATGRKPQDHGVLDFVEVDGEGQLVPVTRFRRRVPALWDLASARGLASGFVGWYASFPAAEVKGFQVSDRLGFHQVKSARSAAGATFPPALADDLRRHFGEARPSLQATRARFLDDPAAQVDADGEKRLLELARIHATAELYRHATPYLQRRFHPALLGVYFELVDACSHLFMEDAPPRRPEVSDAAYAAFAGTADRCYQYQDEVLGELLEMAGPQTVTVICSDHGFKSDALRPRTSGRADTGVAGLWHRLQGVLYVSGKGVRRGRAISGAGVLDVAPTILSLLHIPLSAELPGHPLAAAFEPGALSPVRRLDRYAWHPPAGGATRALADPEAIERLHALGYLGGTATPAHDPGGRTASSFVNEGTSRVADGDAAGARRAFSEALRLDPRRVDAMVSAAHLESESGDLAAAGKLLERALVVNPRSVFVHLERADWALRAADWTLAGQELAAAAALDDRLVRLPLLEAKLHNATGRPAEALADLARAEGLAEGDDLRAEILLFRARVAAESGRLELARAALAQAATLASERALEAARGDLALARGQFGEAARHLAVAAQSSPHDSVLERKLGQALAGKGDHDAAEAAFRHAVAKAANGAEREGALGDLGLLMQMEGRDDRAVVELERACHELPGSAGLWGMLGAAYGRLGALDKALEAYQRSVAIQPTPLALNTLAALYLEHRHDRATAVALWRRSLALAPDQADVRRFVASYGG